MRFLKATLGIILGFLLAAGFLILTTQMLGLEWWERISFRGAGYQFFSLGLGSTDIKPLANLVAVIVTGGVFFGLVATVTNYFPLSRRDQTIFAVLLTLIAIIATGAIFGELMVVTYGVGLGGLGVLAGGSSAGAHLKRKSPSGILIASLAMLDAILIIVNPNLGELQVVFGILAMLSAREMFHHLRYLAQDSGYPWSQILSPPVVGVSVFSALVLVPVFIPSWPVIQGILFYIALMLGLVATEDPFRN